MSAIRQVLLSSLVFTLVPTGLLHGASQAGQYVGGTVQSIPVNSTGALNLDDSQELRFNYNGSTFKLPYEQVTNTELGNIETRKVLGKIPFVSPVPRHWKRVLSISYKDAAGTPGTVRFELQANDATAARDTIALKVAGPQDNASAQEWWGDKLWKTNRNKESWDAANKQASRPSTSTSNGNQ